MEWNRITPDPRSLPDGRQPNQIDSDWSDDLVLRWDTRTKKERCQAIRAAIRIADYVIATTNIILLTIAAICMVGLMRLFFPLIVSVINYLWGLIK